MRVNRAVAAVLAAAVLLLASTSAHADPSAADRESARSLMDEGDKKRAEGDIKGALENFKQADALVGVPTTGLEVARTQIQLGQLLQARDTLGRVLRLPAKPGEPAPFTAAREAAKTLNAEVVAKIPSVQIVLENVAPDLTPQVIVDDETIPSAAVSAPRKVNPGMHVITVKTGTGDLKQDVDVLERDTKTVTFDLKGHGGGGGSTTETGKSSTTSKVFLFGGFGLAVVGIGVGAVTGVMSLSKVSELEPECPNGKCPKKREGDIDSATSLGNISTAAFIVGGVGLGAGVIGLLTSGSKPKTDPPPSAEARLHRPASVFAPEQVRAVLGPSYVGVAGAF